jgi:hypothetical protein
MKKRGQTVGSMCLALFFRKRLLKLAELESAQATGTKQQQLRKESKSSDGRRKRRDYNKWEKKEEKEEKRL